jgi:hypothetical protein
MDLLRKDTGGVFFVEISRARCRGAGAARAAGAGGETGGGGAQAAPSVGVFAGISISEAAPLPLRLAQMSDQVGFHQRAQCNGFSPDKQLVWVCREWLVC